VGRASFELAGNFSEKGGPGKYALEICTQAPGKAEKKVEAPNDQVPKTTWWLNEKEEERRGTTENGKETDGGNGLNGGRVQKKGRW
jgi:hypothetical protein